MIYLDNAATSWPKPDSVYDAVLDTMKNKGGNPGRSGHKHSIAAGQVMDVARFSLSRLFGIDDPGRIVFCLNATDALNLGINGIMNGDGHVISSSMEHNSVVRPIEYQLLKGAECTKIPMDPATGIDIEDFKKAVRPDTKMAVITHASNVTGAVNPLKAIGEICKNEKIILLVDASQSAGSIPIDVKEMGIDMLAFPGHKGLLGPLGTGGLYIGESISVEPVRFGGTGAFSEMRYQPDELPFRYESGTQNVHGTAGLNEGVRYLMDRTVESIYEQERELTTLMAKKLSMINEVTLYGYDDDSVRASTISINLRNTDCAEVAMILDTSFDIAVRAGLHCSPDAHKTLGTMEIGGTVRISIGAFNTEDDILKLVDVIKSIAAQ